MEADNATSTMSQGDYPRRIALKIANGELKLRDNVNKSRCWDIFAEIEDPQGELVTGFVYCRMCHKVYNFKNFSRSNLVRHSCYVEKYLKNQESSISIIKIENTELQPQTVEYFENANSHLIKLITKWVINDCKSYSLFQDSGLRTIFQEFISLGAKFGTDVIKFLPTASTVANNVTEIYAQCAHRLKTEMKAIKESGFGLTTDIWTDSYTKRSYIALNVHYLKNGSLTFCLLGLKSIDGTKQNICETVEIILKDFDCALSHKTIIVTKSDGAVMKAFPKIKSIPCISHLLNKALKNALAEVPEVAELASASIKLVNFMKESNIKNDLVDLLQSFSPNRYISIHKMFRSIKNNFTVLTNTLRDQNESKRMASIKLKDLRAIVKALRPLDEAIKTLEEDSEATLHLVLIYLHDLIKCCDVKKDTFQELSHIVRFKEILQFHLEVIIAENTTILHKIALFLYPPTNKLLLFSDAQKKTVEDECMRLCLQNEIKPTMRPKIKVKWDRLFSDFVEPELDDLTANEIIKRELQCYKNMHVTNSEDFDCFNWWELHKNVFPFLYKLSCCILATPASAASTQQVFTVAGNLLGKITLDLNSNETEVEKMFFINFNGEQDELYSQE